MLSVLDFLGPRAGKKKAYTPAPVKNFSLPKKNGGHREKTSVVDMAFLFFSYRVFVSTTDLESFLGQKSSSRDYLSVVVVYVFFFSAGAERPRELIEFVDFVRAACLQNETAPEKFLNQYEKGFEKHEKRSETCLKMFSPLSPLKNDIAPILFFGTEFRKYVTAQNLALHKYIFWNLTVICKHTGQNGRYRLKPWFL